MADLSRSVDADMGGDAALDDPGLHVELLVGAGDETAFERFGGFGNDRFWSEVREIVDRDGTRGPWDTRRAAFSRPRLSEPGAIESIDFDIQSQRPGHALSDGVDWLLFWEAPDGLVLGEVHSTPVLLAWPAGDEPFVVPLPARTEVQALAPDGNGGVWLAGVAPGSADLGSGPLRPEGGTPTFVAHVLSADVREGEMIGQASQVDELVAMGEGRLALRMTVEPDRTLYGTSIPMGSVLAVIDPASDSLLGSWVIPGEPTSLTTVAEGLRLVFEWSGEVVSFGDHSYEPIAGSASTFVELAWSGTENPPMGERWVVDPSRVDADGVTFAAVGTNGGLMAKPVDTFWVFTVMEGPTRASTGVWSGQRPNFRYRQHVGPWIFSSFDADRDLNVDFEILETPLGGPTQWALRFDREGAVVDVLTFPLEDASLNGSFTTAVGENHVMHLPEVEGDGSSLPIEVLEWSGTQVLAEEARAEAEGACSMTWINGVAHADFRLFTACGGPHTVTVGEVDVTYQYAQSITWVRFRYVD